ncbi:hypothetical protein [Halomicronema sp. CCY15110]|uniref:hypothetical protein n=1 Tax=Halomicronema sp. CCY15110 TaxID=2767773 RepID=UPI0019524605|nr:hypothetical protein [Halomicronema sp. CCY15110]
MTHSTNHSKLFKFSPVELLLMFLLATALGASSVFAWQEIRHQTDLALTEQLQTDLKNLDKEFLQTQKSEKATKNLLSEANKKVITLSNELEAAQASISALETQLSTTQEQAAQLNAQAISLQEDTKLLTSCIRDVYPLANEYSQLNIYNGESLRMAVFTVPALYLHTRALNQSWNTGSCQQAQAVLDRYP